MTNRMRTALTLSCLLTVCMFTAIGVEEAALAAGRDNADPVVTVDAGAPTIPAPPPDSLGDAPRVPMIVVPPAAETAKEAPSVEDPMGTLAELVTFARTGKGRLAIGCALVLLVWLLRSYVLQRIQFFTSKLGGYAAGFGTAAILYVGGGLAADMPLTFNLIADALVAGFAASGKYEALADLARTKITPNMRMGAVSFAAIIAGVYITVSACGGRPIPIAHTVIDCINENHDAKDKLEAELMPLIVGVKPDWSAVGDKALDAGVKVGGCVLAELVQRYLAPPAGRMAPAVDEGHAARDALEQFRAKHASGATFRTAAGDL